MLVVVEDVPNDRPDLWDNSFLGYPVNAMRNIALDAATTDVCVLGWRGIHTRMTPDVLVCIAVDVLVVMNSC